MSAVANDDTKLLAQVQEMFDRWADDRIGDYRSIPDLGDMHIIRCQGRIQALEAAKRNLRHIITEIGGG